MLLRLGMGRRARANMALGNEPSAAADVAAVLEIETSSPDALKLQAELDQARIVRAKAAVHAQKKAFGSFWGSSKGATEGLGGGAPHSKPPAAKLYGDKVREAQGLSKEVFCWMRLAVAGRALGQRVVLQLHPKWGPKTVENFRCLCTGEKKGPSGEPLTYAGSAIHRVCRGFVLQVPAATRTHIAQSACVLVWRPLTCRRRRAATSCISTATASGKVWPPSMAVALRLRRRWAA